MTDDPTREGSGEALGGPEPTLLPPREEMSLIDPDPSGGVGHQFLGGPEPVAEDDAPGR